MGLERVRQGYAVVCALSTPFRGLAVVAAILAPGVGLAQSTVVGGCLQENAGFNTNCTANDIQIAQATNIEILDDGCAYPGDTVHFLADFEVLLNAQERHDVGLYFAVDGDPDGSGATSGVCSTSVMAFNPDPPWLDLDGTLDGGFCENDPTLGCVVDRDCKAVGGACALTQDLCGDIDGAHNPLYPSIEVTTECIDPDGDHMLDFPYCVSWRQPGANELCLDPADAYPGSPSKCNCDPGFEVDIYVPAAELTVTKTASVSSVDEPGDVVTFTVSVHNDSPFATLTLDSLDDDVYGDITQVQGDISATSCGVPSTVAPGDDYTCTFDALVSGPGASVHVDTVTADATDENGNSLSGQDDATVAIDDVLPSISLVKVANPTEVLEPGDDVTFTATITNTSTVDAVTVYSLTDTVYGNVDGLGSCVLPQDLDLQASYTCSFTAMVSGPPGTFETNIMTAEAVDDEGSIAMASDSATVDINDVPSTIEVVKLASPMSLDEPGGLVTYSFTVTNLSAVDTVFVDSLVDDVIGDLDGLGTCAVPQTLAPGAAYSCNATVSVSGNAGEFVTNVVVASGLDDDGNPVSDSDDATVTFLDVEPAATLTKTPIEAVVPFEVVVTNDSTAEPLALQALVDDRFGDVTSVGGDVLATTCSVPQTLEPKGSAGDSYQCSFDALITSSPHTDTVTGTVVDDEANEISPSDDATVTF